MRKGLGKCNVTCPMCSNAHVQYRLNPRMYWNTGVDLDGKPTGFCTLKSIEGFFPPLYDLWHCPQCHFTCHNRTFLDPLKNVFVQKGFVQRRYAEEMREEGPLRLACSLLGDRLTLGDSVSYTEGIRMALLAVLCDQVISRILSQRHAQLARSYLRVAWLHRDWRTTDPDVDENVAQLTTLVTDVRGHWPDVPETEEAALRGACASFSKALKEPSVSGSMDESIDILLTLSKINLQIKEAEEAIELLQLCRTEAGVVMNEIRQELRRDERGKHLSTEDRAKKVQTNRRMEKSLYEIDDLMEKAREMHRGLSG